MIRAQYIDHMGNDLTVVNAARVSFAKSTDAFTERDEKLVNYLAKHQHMSPFEHCQLTVLIDCPIYIAQQILRHRTGKFNMVSRRYTSKDIKFYEPNVLRKQHEKSKQCSDGELEGDNNNLAQVCIQKVHQEALNTYNKLLDLGVSREMARGVLPQNLMTSFYMTMDLRNLAHFVKLREDTHAQEEVQIIAKDIKEILKHKFPKSTKALLES